MQRGCMKRRNRKEGPDVGQFRWSETSLEGKRLYHKKISGLPTICPGPPHCLSEPMWRNGLNPALSIRANVKSVSRQVYRTARRLRDRQYFYNSMTCACGI